MEYTKKIAKDVATIEIKLTRDEYEEFAVKAYEKDKAHYNVEGFRKGKAPKKVIEKAYGEQVFFETAVNMIIEKHYFDILDKEKKLNVIDRPDVSLKSFDDKGITLSMRVQLFPEIKLGAYEGLEIEKNKVTVTEEDINAELKKYQEQSMRMVDILDKPVENGNLVVIDFEGKVDGVAFAGGTAKKYELEIGSHSFIDNFEDQIIGMNIGETRDINVTFPENYHEASLKGKPAVFTIVLHSIKTKEYPELNDEFASNCSTFETLEDFKKDIEKNILAEREKQAEYDVEEKIINEISKNTVVEVPEIFIQEQLEDELKRIENNLRYQGVDLKTYCQIVGTTVEKIKEDIRPSAKENVKSQLVIQEIVKKENIKAEDEEIDNKLEEIAKNMKKTKEEYMKMASPNVMNSIANSIIIEKLFKLLKEKNNIK